MKIPGTASAEIPLANVADVVACHLLDQAVWAGTGLRRIHRASVRHRRVDRAKLVNQHFLSDGVRLTSTASSYLD